MTENVPPHPNPLPQRGEGVRRENIFPSTYKKQKRGHFTTVKIKKYLSLYLYRCKKGAKKKPMDKKY
jgi:hypothetical protein